MPILMEHFVSVKGEEEAKTNAEKWRFLPKAWKPGYFNNISPMAIQKRAESEIPLSRVYGSWAVSTDPHMHVQAILKWVDLGVTHILVHSAQANQPAVVDFFGKQVLPLVRGGGITGVRQVTMG